MSLSSGFRSISKFLGVVLIGAGAYGFHATGYEQGQDQATTEALKAQHIPAIAQAQQDKKANDQKYLWATRYKATEVGVTREQLLNYGPWAGVIGGTMLMLVRSQKPTAGGPSQG